VVAAVLFAAGLWASAAAGRGEAAQQPACGFVGSDCNDGPRLRFAGGEASVDALVEKLFAALEHKDLDALRQLRVSKDEYQQIVAPGGFRPGEKPKVFSPEVQKYFWDDLDYKSEIYGKNLIRQFGGRTFPSRKVRFSKPSPQRYGWYQVYGELRVDLENPPSMPEELQTGAIVEFQGRCKFIAFGYD
jgi:hypothetical protein